VTAVLLIYILQKNFKKFTLRKSLVKNGYRDPLSKKDTDKRKIVRLQAIKKYRGVRA
jgi:hypothetical protein